MGLATRAKAVQVKLWPDFRNIQHSTFNAQHPRNAQIECPWKLKVDTILQSSRSLRRSSILSGCGNAASGLRG
jgi:hypothetical protein